jgi:DNA repair protein RecN (Recombination protein N)
LLENLHIVNYALIEELELDFSNGMNTLTGETGAGKSILAGALGLLLGAKATTASIRNGCDQARVSGTFLLPPEGDAARDSREWLEEQGIEPEDDRVIIRRVLKSTGKGNSFIQGNMIPLQKLEEFTAILLDMHGQHEHQSLFNIQHHRRFIDAYGDLTDLRDKVQRDFLFLNEKKEELDTLLNDERERDREIELLRYAIREIDELDIQPGEDDALESERIRLQQYEKLFAHIDGAHNALKEEGGGAIGLVYAAVKALQAASGIDESQRDNAGRLESLYYELEDISGQVSGYLDDLSYDPQRLEFIEERLAEITRVKRKYGANLGDVARYRQEAEEKLEHFEHSDEYIAQLKKEIVKLENDLIETARRLSAGRKEASGRLEGQVRGSLAALGMPKARFSVSLTQKLSERGVPVCGASGIDRVEFLLSANAGEPLKPLRSIASGGEISRVMLAIKTALADSDDIPTLVFDEIDSGIGGEVGRALGEHLQNLSSRKQILCITHLASIAAHADNHIRVSKIEAGGRTITTAEAVRDRRRIEEIARMLSGDSQTEASLSHAEQLLTSSSK